MKAIWRTRLEAAIAYAVTAHAGQMDLNGMPYILHVLRVMGLGTTPEEKIIGVLHDVVEDCGGWEGNPTLLHIVGPPGSPLYEALDAITHRKKAGERYAAYIRRLAANPIARAVKLNDVTDNSLPARVATLPPHLTKIRRRIARLYPAVLKYLRAKEGPSERSEEEAMSYRVSPMADISGTELVGYLPNGTTYQSLVALLGEPIRFVEEGKVQVMWVLRFWGGRVATIYDYKNSQPVEQITFWHVGGRRGTGLLTRVQQIVRERIAPEGA